MSGIERGDTAQAGLASAQPATDDKGDDLVRAASTTVLIAVEDSESESVSVVRIAHHLFGDDARYS